METAPLPKPPWIRSRAPSGDIPEQLGGVLGRLRLHTVCDEAECPNKGECWGAGTAAFMIMGDICTRSCRFCAVRSAKEGRPLDAEEPSRLARAAVELGLRYVVLTSVDRDDLAGRGAPHFAACVRALREADASIQAEVLIPDYDRAELAPVLEAAPDVLAHNVETVRSLQHVRDRRAGFDKSLATLRAAKRGGGGFAPLTKSSLILGMGETRGEVLAAMDELREAEVDILVIGQYLRPSGRQIPVAAYITPEEFERYGAEARSRGFAAVVSAPLARTSYHAFGAAAAAEGRGAY
jgi:lipoic acid synthetase